MRKSILYKLFFIPLIALGFGISMLTNNFNITTHVAKADSGINTIIGNEGYFDFSNDSVIVVLESNISQVNKKHEESFFEGVEIETIEDLTSRKYNLNLDEVNFKQILKITLKNKSKENILSAIEKLALIDGILSVEPNYYYSLEAIPSDPYYESGELWGLTSINGIQVTSAWDITKGSKNVRVGIIDTGISNHIDLNTNLVEGWDTFNDNSITMDDTHSHGTHVAGTIGAVGNNDIGVVGVNWEVQLVPLQAANENNRFYSGDVVEAISWASEKWGTSEQIDIINYSVGGFGNTTAVREAIRSYQGLFIWSAGNDTEDVDLRISKNGSFNLDNLISVGSIGNTNARSSFSNYSANNTNVNIYAPGESIVSTGLNDSYVWKSGTSMAAPHVTGVAALMLSVNPNLSSAELKSEILNNSDEITISIPDGNGGTTTQRVKKLNAYKSVEAVSDFYEITIDLGYEDTYKTLLTDYKGRFNADSYDSEYIFNRTGYDLQGIYSEPNGGGIQYFGYEIVKPASEYVYKLVSTGETWDQQSDGMVYAYWTLVGGNYEYSINISNADEQLKRTISLTHGTNVTITAPSIDGYTFESMWVNGTTYTTSTVQLNNVQLRRNLGYEFLGNVIGNEPFHIWYMPYGATTNQGGLHMTYKKNECVAAGTLITLADGSQVPVETLTGNERLLVWNLHTGRFDTAPILFIDHDSAQVYKIINLYFSDGTRVKVISEHAFWDFDLNKYVFLREDAAQYLGHWFNKQTTDAMGNMVWTRVQLTSVTITEEYTTAWSPVTYGHLCIYVNGMLSMPGATSGLINIFEVDGETMQINQEQYLADIATYGLFTYEEFSEIYTIPEEMFNAVNGQYLKVSIGKRLIDYETLGNLIETYSHFFE